MSVLAALLPLYLLKYSCFSLLVSLYNNVGQPLYPYAPLPVSSSRSPPLWVITELPAGWLFTRGRSCMSALLSVSPSPSTEENFC